MGITLGQADLAKLNGVHADLERVVLCAADISDLRFSILEGMRTLTRQKQLYAQGATRTMNSRHLTGHAVDIAPLDGGKVSWDWALYNRLAPIIFKAAELEGVPIEWGGQWTKFRDGAHWQLPFKNYPKGNG